MSYIHTLFGLVLGAGAERILVLGGAGGTLGSMLARAGKHVTVVDIDRHAFAVARDFFNLAPEVDCRIADGRSFIERSRARYDAIVLDAYCRGSAPGHLCTTEFFSIARRRLRAGGVILFNAIVGNDRDPNADRIAAGMIAAGLPVRILDTLGETHRNAIIVAGGRHRWRRPAILVKPAIMMREIVDELGEMDFRTPRPCDPVIDDDLRPR